MIEKKATLVAAIVALALIGGPLAASAAPIQTSKTIVTTFHTEDEEHEDDGDDDEDDGDHNGYIPPVFVVPGHKKPHKEHGEKPVATTPTTAPSAEIDPATGLPIETSSIDPVTGQEFVVVGAGGDPASESLGGVNPEEARAVDIRRVPTRIHTPADQFMDAAYIGLGMLTLAALGLGGTAATRAIRLRRSGKSDYFYGDK
ncbi:MAG: hypothetical protein RJA45_163 [Actinomycetota bacterium]|jgi:hypothetical protein